MDIGDGDLETVMELADFDVNKLDQFALAASSNVWSTPQLRPHQQEAIRFIMHPCKPNNVIINHRTGSGKTHIVRVVGVCERAITLIFIPLLTLSADVMQKFTCANDTWGTVEVQHLDELYEANRSKYTTFLQRCRSMQRSTTSTTFVFLSPQFLVNHQDALAVFLHCAAERTLRLVVEDEAHLKVQHGMSFRGEIRQLRTIFYRKVFDPMNRRNWPKTIFLTGTLPTDYIADLTTLTTIPFPPECILRGSRESFSQREIMIRQTVTNKGDFVKKGLAEVVQHLIDHPDDSVVVFCNSRTKSLHYLKLLEHKLNASHCGTDCIHIHGALHRMDKFMRIKLFCEARGMELNDMDFRCLLTTNASNVGIDKHSITRQIRDEIPRDLPTYNQEMARGSRVPGKASESHLYYDMKSYVLVKQQILTTKRDDEIVVPELGKEVLGFNSALSPLSKRAAAAATKADAKRDKYPLSSARKKKLKVRQLREVEEMLRFLALDNGCQHALREWYLHTGVFEKPPDSANIPRCVTRCPICTKEWYKLYLPVYKKGVIDFLESRVAQAFLPRPIDLGTVSDMLKDNVFWIETIFDRAKSGVKKTHVDALFFSLAAAKILDLEKVNGVIHWNVSYDYDIENPLNETRRYNIDSSWKGVHLFESTRTRRRIPTVPKLPDKDKK